MPRDFLSDDYGSQSAPVNISGGRDYLAEPPKEDLATAAVYAVPRVLTDVSQGIYNFANEVPGYMNAAKTEFPGLLNALQQHPGRLGMQGLAGINEAINSLAQAPLNLAQYGANRLNLLPQSVPNAISKITPEDTTQAINQLFGQPQYPGENLFRGVMRNIPNIALTKNLAPVLNPLKLTDKGLTKSVIKELGNQVEKHTDMYNSLWKEAHNQGFNRVPYNPQLLNQNVGIIQKYYTPKQYASVDKFINNPTLENAQRAQSDLGVLRRSIEEKARTTPLLGEERALHDALSNAEKHIESNMFKDQHGNLNKNLADKYSAITNSYRENVVPYKYNKDIQAYLNKEITEKQLVQRLNNGEFAVKKGGSHPAFKVRNMLAPVVKGAVGSLGGYGIGKYLYEQLLGKPSQQ